MFLSDEALYARNVTVYISICISTCTAYMQYTNVQILIRGTQLAGRWVTSSPRTNTQEAVNQ